MSHNRLANEPSPYLVQHKDNPVHWYPWGDEAFEEASKTGKPVLLSIGYAACHWCHVMAHESFEDEATAGLMNELFVNVKLDREERPDIDKIYMEALHHLGQQGGWPLTMFLNADRQPFWGGTYFPKTPQFGRPSFSQVLTQVSEIYRTAPDKVTSNCEALTEALNRQPRKTVSSSSTLSLDVIDQVARQIHSIVDHRKGGLQGAPKFPQFPIFQLLWRHYIRTDDQTSRNAVLVTLQNLCQGGIYDHLRGGLARYSVDDRWLAPHFEKMLYDNAQLLDLLSLVWQDTKDELFRIRIEETIAWVQAEMIAEHGAFAASLDADSEGVEGKFYVWSKAEITDILETDAERFCEIYDISDQGNWEHTNILNRLDHLDLMDPATEATLAQNRATLLEHRSKRIRPGFDDKVLTDWNGLMIASITRCAMIFDRSDWLATAERAYTGVREVLCSGPHFLQSHRNGQTRYHATADGYTNMIRAALQLHEATGTQDYLENAENWTTDLRNHFWDMDVGGLFYTSSEADDLIRRTKSAADDAIPNANATQLSNYSRLYQMTGNPAHAGSGQEILSAFDADVSAAAIAHAGFLSGAEDLISPLQAVIIATKDEDTADQFERELLARCLPTLTITNFDSGESLPIDHPAYAKRDVETATLFLCKGQTCSLPITDPDEIAAALATFAVRASAEG